MTYELRTTRGVPVMTFDNETRAREYMARHSRRVGIPFELFRLRTIAEKVG